MIRRVLWRLWLDSNADYSLLGTLHLSFWIPYQGCLHSATATCFSPQTSSGVAWASDGIDRQTTTTWSWAQLRIWHKQKSLQRVSGIGDFIFSRAETCSPDRTNKVSNLPVTFLENSGAGFDLDQKPDTVSQLEHRFRHPNHRWWCHFLGAPASQWQNALARCWVPLRYAPFEPIIPRYPKLKVSEP